jgi:hypothetical protein
MTNYRISSLKKGLIAHYPLNSKSEKVGSELSNSIFQDYIGQFETFENASREGFHGVSDGEDNTYGVTDDDISVTAGKTYKLSFNLTNHSGTKPTYVIRKNRVGGDIIIHGASSEGFNEILFDAVNTENVVGYFFVPLKASDYTISDFSVKEVQTADTTPNANHGVVYGATQNASSMEFDGTDDYVEGTELNQIQNSEELTFSGWINLTKNAIYQFPIDFYYNLLNRVRFGISSNGFLMVNSEILNDSITSNYDYDISDSWHHITMTRDGSFLKTYVDGVFVNSNDCTHSNSDMPGNAKLYIGSENNNYFCEGSIKDVRIYNRALTAEEVELLYKLNGEDVGLRI